MDGTVRIGKISDVDIDNRTARVHFPDVDIISGWLKVICVADWLPDVNDTVLCLFTDGFNGDGFILGALI